MTQRTIIEATVIRADGTVEELGVIGEAKKETFLQKLIRGVKK